MSKEIRPITLTAIPTRLDECFEVMQKAGAEQFALFGGAVRDTDYAAYYGREPRIKDYDMRVWLPPEEYDEHMRKFVVNLGRVAASPVREVPAGGTPHMRYCFDLGDTEMDVSVRPIKDGAVLLAGAAIDRVRDADIGLSSVAIAADGTAWATPEYVDDRNNRTLTVYPHPNADRLAEYTARMALKYPDHTIIRLS